MTTQTRTRGPQWTGPRWRTYGEVYAYRTRKPGALLRIPFVSFHWAYVGQTRNPAMRHTEHTQGGGRYGKVSASWSDLEPRRFVLWSMKRCPQWLLNGAEFFFVKALQPVYNEKMNRPNLRRISRKRAAAARRRREMGMRWSPVATMAHAVLFMVALVVLLAGVAR